jgi:hypothetical protein
MPPHRIQLPSHSRGVWVVDGRRHHPVELPLTSGCFPLGTSLLAMVTATGAILRSDATVRALGPPGQQGMPPLDGLPDLLLDRYDRQTHIAGPFSDRNLSAVPLSCSSPHRGVDVDGSEIDQRRSPVDKGSTLGP